MKATNFRKVKETEKAILFVVGFKFNENMPKIVCGVEGEQSFMTGKEVEMWMPKSVINEEGIIADWFAKKIYEAFGRFGLRDVIYA